MLLNLLGLSLFTAAFALFLQMCYQPGHVFYRWYLYLQAVYTRSWRRKDRWKRHFTKPLGLCPYCQTVWFHSFFFVVLTEAGVWWWLLSVGVNYVWLELLLKVVPKQEREPFQRIIRKQMITEQEIKKLAKAVGGTEAQVRQAVEDAERGDFERLKDFGFQVLRTPDSHRVLIRFRGFSVECLVTPGEIDFKLARFINTLLV